MARLPRGIRLVNPHVVGELVLYDIKVSLWRKILMTLQAVWNFHKGILVEDKRRTYGPQ